MIHRYDKKRVSADKIIINEAEKHWTTIIHLVAK